MGPTDGGPGQAGLGRSRYLGRWPSAGAREKGSGWGTWPGVTYESQGPRLVGSDGHSYFVSTVFTK